MIFVTAARQIQFIDSFRLLHLPRAPQKMSYITALFGLEGQLGHLLLTLNIPTNNHHLTQEPHLEPHLEPQPVMASRLLRL